LEFLSERNVLSAKDNIGGGSINVFLSHGCAGMNIASVFDFI
jgi:hypothetical protein